MKCHLVLYTTLFPTLREPSREIFTAQLAQALSRHYRVTVIYPIPWLATLPGFRRLGVYRKYAGEPFHYNKGDIEVYHPRHLIVRGLPLILHSWFQSVACARLLQRLHRQDRIHAINAHWAYPDGVAAAHLARTIGCPILVTALGSDINVSGEFPRRRQQISQMLKSVEAASGVSRALAARLIALGAPPHRTHYLPNGVNKQIFSLAPLEQRELLCNELGLNPSRKYLLFVGRLHPVKGLRFLIEALSILNQASRLNFETLLIGSGELESELKADIRARALENVVRLVGSIDHSAVPNWLRIGDAFCLPSLMEGMPNVVLEALACGLPIVATRVGALPDVVNSESGILVPAGDAAALAQAIGEVMERAWDRGLIASSAGTPDWNEVAQMYGKVINSIVAERNSPAHKTEL